MSSNQDGSKAKSASARYETITVSLTADIKEALDREVEARKAAGERASVNFVAWERIRYTYELTGKDGETIAPFEDRLKQDNGSDAVRALLVSAIFEKCKRAPRFAAKVPDMTLLRRGRPRGLSSSSGLPILGGPPVRRKPPASDYLETENLSLLRSDLREAIGNLTLHSDAPIEDEALPDIGTLGSANGPALLRRLLSDLQSRVPSKDEFEALTIVRQQRILRRLHKEWSALREALITHALAAYAMMWAQIRDDAIDEVLPHSETDLFDEVLEARAELAAGRLDEAHDQLRARLLRDDEEIEACADQIKSISSDADKLYFPYGPNGPDLGGGLFGFGESVPETE